MPVCMPQCAVEPADHLPKGVKPHQHRYFGKPRQIKELDEPVTSLCISEVHSLALTSKSEVWVWGSTQKGLSGLEDLSDKKYYVAVPRVISGLQGTAVVQIACSKLHSLAVTKEGRVYAWGDGSDGRLGLASLEEHCETTDKCIQKTPAALECFDRGFGEDLDRFIVSVACGPQHSLAVTKSGRVWAWGRANCGRCGLKGVQKLKGSGGTAEELPGELRRSKKPQLYAPVPFMLKEGLEGVTVTAVTCGNFHNIFTDSEGGLLACGDASHGKLGVPDVSSLPTDSDGEPFSDIPVRIPLDALNGAKVADVQAAGFHTVILTETGETYAFGVVKLGRCAIQDYDSHPIKTQKGGVCT